MICFLRIHLFGQNTYESIYSLESEYISFCAIEYEYNYPWRDMDLSPIDCQLFAKVFTWNAKCQNVIENQKESKGDGIELYRGPGFVDSQTVNSSHRPSTKPQYKASTLCKKSPVPVLCMFISCCTALYP